MNIFKSATSVLTTLLCVAGCEDSSGPILQPLQPGGTTTTPFVVPPPAGFVVRGQVYDFYNGLIDDGGVNIWVTLGNGSGYSYWWAYGRLSSANGGRYETTSLPESTISIAVFKHGYVQPCVYTLDLRGPPRDLEQNIEMMSQAVLDSFSPPRPSILPGPSFTGMVFETTPTGRQPVAGAEVWVDGLGGDGVYLGRTYSDFGGNYFLCNLPPHAVLVVSKPGFETVYTGRTGTASQLDIELQRLP